MKLNCAGNCALERLANGKETGEPWRLLPRAERIEIGNGAEKLPPLLAQRVYRPQVVGIIVGMTEDLLEIIMRRYERASTIVTSNRPVEDWGKLLGDAATVSAMLDRGTDAPSTKGKVRKGGSL